MEYANLDQMVKEREGIIARAFPAVMKKVYLWMTLALGITGMTAWLIARDPVMVQNIFGNSATMWILLIAEIGVVVWLTARIQKMSLTTATLLFILYSVINGVTMSVIFLAYDMGSIANTFFITAGTFAAMTVVGLKTEKNLSGMGRYLLMALIGLCIATVVNIFLGSSMMDMIISYVGVAIFVGLTAYDTQKIRDMLAVSDEYDPDTQKIAVIGALSLYLDFINLFLYLLRIFGSRD